MNNSSSIFSGLFGGVYMPFRACVKHASLLNMLVKREIIVRTSGTLLGKLWPLLQPALQVAGFWFLFGIVYGMRQDRGPGFLEFFLVGMLPWLCLSEVLNRSVGMFREFSALYRRTPFPIEILPILIMIIPGFVYTIIYGLLCLFIFGPAAAVNSLIVMPLLLLWLLPFVLLFSILGLFIRDFAQALPFFLTLIMYSTPILFLPEMLPAWYQEWLWLNPLADVMTAVHALVQGMPFNPLTAVRLLALWFVLLVPSWLLFRRSMPHIREVL
ncbi:MAG: ABC transporter permease [Pseudomonadota bacterium]